MDFEHAHIAFDQVVVKRDNDDMVRFSQLPQGASFVPPLSTARPLPKAAQTLAPAFLRTIAARWLATIVTVFRQLILQRLDQLLLRPKFLLQNQIQLDQALSV